MPTYDYKCEMCSHRFSEMQSIMADSLKTCPGCGRDGLKRLITAGLPPLFKGPGFYATDYRAPTVDTPRKES